MQQPAQPDLELQPEPELEAEVEAEAEPAVEPDAELVVEPEVEAEMEPIQQPEEELGNPDAEMQVDAMAAEAQAEVADLSEPSADVVGAGQSQMVADNVTELDRNEADQDPSADQTILSVGDSLHYRMWSVGLEST